MGVSDNYQDEIERIRKNKESSVSGASQKGEETNLLTNYTQNKSIAPQQE